MFVCIAVGTGIASYFLNVMCMYDRETERENGRGRYLMRMDRHRAVTFAVCLALCLGLTWLFVQYHYGPLKVIRYLLLLALLYPIALRDAKEKIIPNRWLVYILIIRAVLFMAEIVCFPSLWLENIRFTLAGGAVSGIIFFMAYVVSRHAIGMGDVKLFAVIGMCLGIKTTYLVMIVSLILSAIYGGCMVLGKKKNMKDEIAFGPFAAAGTFLVLLIGA
ncbi:MAG: A24 family peptidase [Lachnospiraceae bacterium]|nr:A24 family peptidase [Lachnospiraceae bacterium]MDE7334295.1 A24 family peptidase [Lachnospiraceae bacterium]